MTGCKRLSFSIVYPKTQLLDMRPRGSKRNRAIAIAFANATMVPVDAKYPHPVPCSGPKSLFSLMSTCLPSVTRDEKPLNKSGVSLVELNKALCSSGYQLVRKREPITGSEGKWARGRQRWRERRYVDVGNDDDLMHLETRLADMHASFPETRGCSSNRIILAMSTGVFRTQQSLNSSVEDRTQQDPYKFDDVSIMMMIEDSTLFFEVSKHDKDSEQPTASFSHQLPVHDALMLSVDDVFMQLNHVSDRKDQGDNHLAASISVDEILHNQWLGPLNISVMEEDDLSDDSDLLNPPLIENAVGASRLQGVCSM